MPTNRITISTATSAAVLASSNTPIARSRRAPVVSTADASATGAAPDPGDECRKLAIVTRGILVERRVAAVVVERDGGALDRRRGHLGGLRQDQFVAPPVGDQCRHRDAGEGLAHQLRVGRPAR